jgi:hypothetical protein
MGVGLTGGVCFAGLIHDRNDNDDDLYGFFFINMILRLLLNTNVKIGEVQS